MLLRFSKFEGLGNDFLVVEHERAPEMSRELAARLSDRHFGVGGDGVLVTGVRRGTPFMDVINADGSVPEMCGNGLRCVALYLVQRGIVGPGEFEISTGAGPHRVRVRPDGAGGEVQVSMSPASLDAGEVLRDVRGDFLDQPFEVDGETLRVSCVSMGNPHAVTFDDIARERFGALGPRIEKDARFRAGANVGFARLHGPTALALTVWERGVGFTLACGTGACAAAVAAVETGRAPREQPLRVELPGGALTIVVPARGERIMMTGPARHVFDGEIETGGAAR